MDKEQEEVQFVGFFGIFKETCKITALSWRKIFSQITLALILALSYIFLAYMHISQLFSILKILDHTQKNTTPSSSKYAKFSDIISSEWTAFCWVFKAAYFTLLLILSHLSTSAVFYTIACIYAAKEITFKKVMSDVPKVCRRLTVTFIWSFVVLLVYNVVAIVIVFLCAAFIGFSVTGIVFLVLVFILYLTGLLYVSVVWHLRSVVSVLEDVYGIQELIKSNSLKKDKMDIAVLGILFFSNCFIVVEMVFEKFLVLGLVLRAAGIGIRIGIGILYFLFLFKVILFAILVQVVIHFFYKSYDHLEVNVGLKAKLKASLKAKLGECLVFGFYLCCVNIVNDHYRGSS